MILKRNIKIAVRLDAWEVPLIEVRMMNRNDTLVFSK